MFCFVREGATVRFGSCDCREKEDGLEEDQMMQERWCKVRKAVVTKIGLEGATEAEAWRCLTETSSFHFGTRGRGQQSHVHGGDER